jgi:hypothetical protein
MKNTLAIMALLATVTLTGHAQQKVRKSVFGVTSGISIPFSDFANDSFTRDAGFAAPGPGIEAEYLYYGKVFGFSSSVGYANFFFNEKGYLAEYDRTLNGYGVNEMAAGNYQVMKFLMGFTLKTPEFRHTEILLLFNVGFSRCVHPDLRVTNSELGVINSMEKDAGGSPAVSAGIKINYWLNNRYGFSLKGSLDNTRPAFFDVTAPDGIFFMPIDYASIKIGFVMNLKRPSL